MASPVRHVLLFPPELEHLQDASRALNARCRGNSRLRAFLSAVCGVVREEIVALSESERASIGIDTFEDFAELVEQHVSRGCRSVLEVAIITTIQISQLFLYVACLMLLSK